MGIIYGLSAAFSGEITLAIGRAQKINFKGFTPMMIGWTPVEVPGCIGELGIPPTASVLYLNF
jgi:hypothetical protein